MNSICSQESSKLKLNWQNLSLVQKSKQKTILDSLTGEIQSGDFLTIMGSSGAGKSSFLSLVTKSMSSFSRNLLVKGKIQFNNQSYTEDEFYAIAGYVPQDDLLLETLTVKCNFLSNAKESFDFQARLKLHDWNDNERQAKVVEVLRLLNLYEVRNTYVGGSGKKSISGGQRKRVAIGIQLISDPMCLILDQPTSGLDSSNSLKIIKFLSKLAQQENKLIIATIHQPSSFMFQNFDKLMVLHKGRQVYFQKASNIVSYMQSINIKVDYRMNPSDFFMLQISSFKENQGYKTPMTYENFKNYQKKNPEKQNPELEDSKSTMFGSIKYAAHKTAPALDQIKPLLVRNFKNFIRCPSNQGGRIMQLIIFPFLIGTIFHDFLDHSPFLNPENSMQTFLLEMVSFFYISLFFTLLQSVYDSLLAFPSQKQLILKQVHSRMYYISVYFISKLMIEIPMMMLSVIISSSTVFFVIGLQSSWHNFLVYEFGFIFVALAGYMIGISIGAICKNQFYAITAGVMIMMPLMTFGGQGVNLRTIPAYSSWFQYLTPLRYGYNILIRNELSTQLYHHIGNEQKTQQFLGLIDTNENNMIELFLLFYGFTVLSFVVLYARRKLG